MKLWWLWVSWAFGGPAASGLTALVVFRHRLRRLLPNRRRVVGEADVVVFARLLMLAMSAGLPLGPAVREAGRHLDGPLADAVEDLDRRSRTAGLTLALAETGGPLGELCSGLVRAQVTGAVMRETVASYVDRRLAATRALAVQRARTLPVKLIVPVALLILPGFILLVAGPTILSQLSGLLGPITRP